MEVENKEGQLAGIFGFKAESLAWAPIGVEHEWGSETGFPRVFAPVDFYLGELLFGGLSWDILRMI
jgi:hypothetical protein